MRVQRKFANLGPCRIALMAVHTFHIEVLRKRKTLVHLTPYLGPKLLAKGKDQTNELLSNANKTIKTRCY